MEQDVSSPTEHSGVEDAKVLRNGIRRRRAASYTTPHAVSAFDLILLLEISWNTETDSWGRLSFGVSRHRRRCVVQYSSHGAPTTVVLAGVRRHRVLW
jgi:hypothetical protein